MDTLKRDQTNPASPGATIQAPPELFEPRPVGINLNRHSNFSPEFVFKDVFKSNSGWVFNMETWQPNTQLVLGEVIPLREEDGYPTEVPYNLNFEVTDSATGAIIIESLPAIARAYLFRGLPHLYPSGTYRIYYEGSGIIHIRGDISYDVSLAASGYDQFTINPAARTENGFWVEIRGSDMSDPIRNIRIIGPPFTLNYLTQPFTRKFINFLRPFQCIRFMDWLRINGSPIRDWENRNHPDYYAQTLQNGVALEYYVLLCNMMGKDLWINIPHAASDDYINHLAIFLRDNVRMNLKIYVEYSNELWNSAPDFRLQHEYVNSFGAGSIPIPSPPPGWAAPWLYTPGRLFTARRAADAFHFFENIFGPSDRLVKVLAGQANGLSVLEGILRAFYNTGDGLPLSPNPYNPYGIEADAIAIAPYFGNQIADTIGDSGMIDSITVEEILEMAGEDLETRTFSNITDHKELAETFGLRLITYEGGQHLAANRALYRDNPVLTQKLTDANRHPGMRDLYCRLLNHWFVHANDLFVHFNSITGYNRFGSFGIKEHMAQSNNSSPKYRALRSCAFNYP